MSAIPCPIILNECPGADSPVLNHSSEAPDPFMYAGIGYNPYNTHGVPPICCGVDPKYDCSNIVWSTISQDMADFIAAATAAGCTVPPWPPIPGVPPFPEPPEINDTGITPGNTGVLIQNNNLRQFSSDEQSLTVTCPDGRIFSKTIEAGAMRSPDVYLEVGPYWVSYMNAWLQADLRRQANEFCQGDPNFDPQYPIFNSDLAGGSIQIPGGGGSSFPTLDLVQFTNDAQTVVLTCPNGSKFSETIPAGTIYSPLMEPSVGPYWIEYINAWIYAYLLSAALADQACMSVPNITERCPNQPAPCDWPVGCPWPPTDASCWPIDWIWPDIPGCPNPPTDPACFPPGTDWTKKANHPHPPTTPNTIISNWPGWICLGETIDPALQTYEVTGSGDWTFAVTGGETPPGTGLVPVGNKSAVLAGTPSAPGYYVWDVTATSGNKTVFTIDAMHVMGVVMPFLPDAIVGVPYSESLSADGGTGPYTFVLESGSLPAGLSMATDGTISGTAIAEEVSSFTVRFTDANSRSCTQTISLEVEITDCITNSGSLPNGAVGSAYSAALVSTLGIAPRTFSTTDSLPNGLTLHADGTIDGTPTAPGITGFEVKVTDSLAEECTDICVITVNSPCGGTPDSFQTAVWNNVAPQYSGCTEGGITGGSGAWKITLTWGYANPCYVPNSSKILSWEAQVCNPGAGYLATITVPWYYDPDVGVPAPPHPQIGVEISVDGLVVSNPGVILEAPFEPNPIVGTFTLPGHSISTVRIKIELFGDVDYGILLITGGIAISPLTPP